MEQTPDSAPTLADPPASPAPFPATSPEIRQLAAENALTQNPHKRSFIVRHWRGELSLPLPRWGIKLLKYVLLGFIVVFVPGIVEALGEQDLYPPAVALACTVVGWAFLGIAYVWLEAGISRSANRDEAGRPSSREVPATIIATICVIGVLLYVFHVIPRISRLTHAALSDMGLPKYEIRVTGNDRTVVSFTGGITYGAARELKKILASNPQIRVLEINSPGGQIDEAWNLSRVVRNARLTTYTTSQCISACTLVFITGERRWLGPSSKLGFHSPDYAVFMSALEADGWESAYKVEYLASKTPQKFADQVYATKGSDMWWPSTDELVSANVISGVAAPENFGL